MPEWLSQTIQTVVIVLAFLWQVGKDIMSPKQAQGKGVVVSTRPLWRKRISKWAPLVAMVVLAIVSWVPRWVSPSMTAEEWLAQPLETISDRDFTNETVVLDGKRFVRCRFTNVKFIYRGTASTDLIQATFPGNSMTMLVVESPAVEAGIRIVEGLRRLKATVSIGEINPKTGKTTNMRPLAP